VTPSGKIEVKIIPSVVKRKLPRSLNHLRGRRTRIGSLYFDAEEVKIVPVHTKVLVNALTGDVNSALIPMSGNPTSRDLARV